MAAVFEVLFYHIIELSLFLLIFGKSIAGLIQYIADIPVRIEKEKTRQIELELKKEKENHSLSSQRYLGYLPKE